MTRKTNEGLYDKDYTGSKKRQDMSRRVEILKKPSLYSDKHSFNNLPSLSIWRAPNLFI